jgi:hypothetical protein
LQSHLISRRVKSLVPSCLKFIFPTVSTGLPDPLRLYPLYYLPSHSTDIYQRTNSVRPSLAFSTQPSTQNSPSLLCQLPRQEYCCPSSVTSRFTPCPTGRPMRSRSRSHAIPRPRPRPCRRCSVSQLPMAYIRSPPTCEYILGLPRTSFYLVQSPTNSPVAPKQEYQVSIFQVIFHNTLSTRCDQSKTFQAWKPPSIILPWQERLVLSFDRLPSIFPFLAFSNKYD